MKKPQQRNARARLAGMLRPSAAIVVLGALLFAAPSCERAEEIQPEEAAARPEATMAALQRMKSLYETSVWLQREETPNCYDDIEEEIRRMDDPRLLFLIALYFDSVAFPRLTGPTDEQAELRTPEDEFYVNEFQYCCTLNAHASAVRDVAVARLEEWQRSPACSEQQRKEINAMLQYIHTVMPRLSA